MTAASVTAALHEYEEALRSIDAPVLKWVHRGASAAELAAAESKAGFTLPEDARAVWAWHNGTTWPSVPDRMSYFTPGSFFPDLDRAVSRGREQTDNWVDAMGEDSGYVGTRLVALLIGVIGPTLMVVDCANADAEDTPALTLGHSERFDEAIDRFSITETIRLWSSWVRNGWWSIDDRGFWKVDDAKFAYREDRFQF